MGEDVLAVESMISRPPQFSFQLRPGLVGVAAALQHLTDRVAAGHFHRKAIRVELHLPAQRQIEQVEAFENHFEEKPHIAKQSQKNISKDGDAWIPILHVAKEMIKEI